MMNSNNFEGKKVLNFSEAAMLTGFSKSYLYKLTSQGKIPCYRPIGKIIFFKKEEIEQWMLTDNSGRNNVYPEINTQNKID